MESLEFSIDLLDLAICQSYIALFVLARHVESKTEVETDLYVVSMSAMMARLLERKQNGWV